MFSNLNESMAEKNGWFCGHQEISSSNSDQVSLKKPERGRKASTYSKFPMTSGNIFLWKIKVFGPPGFSIGVTTPTLFGNGDFPIGLFYRGSLSDGTKTLLSNYGPEIFDQDEVTMLVDFAFTSPRLKISFLHNTKPLSTAFNLDIFPSTLHVCITSVTGPCCVEVRQQDSENLDKISFELEDSKSPAGTWKEKSISPTGRPRISDFFKSQSGDKESEVLLDNCKLQITQKEKLYVVVQVQKFVSKFSGTVVKDKVNFVEEATPLPLPLLGEKMSRKIKIVRSLFSNDSKISLINGNLKIVSYLQ
eukprot:GHVP01000045.1.p1 GENE.GHVP01000045.1~~GHVP01000045.1.p1  ORF type:complete len:305 (+),score=50.47 GHVP01000045.1:175-1089(+)